LRLREFRHQALGLRYQKNPEFEVSKQKSSPNDASGPGLRVVYLIDYEQISKLPPALIIFFLTRKIFS